MSARTPEEMVRLWEEHFVAGDLDALVALYEPDATLVAQPGEVVTGTEAIREDLSGLLAMRPTFSLEGRKVLQTSDIALSFADWTLAGTSPDGEPIEMAGHTSNVLRRQPDGTRRFVIDNPWGSAHGF
jgi:ketosteroid isomerase-like protein